MFRMLTNFLVAGAVLPAAEALLVAPGSPCSNNCGNTLDSTSSDDVACQWDAATGAFHSDDAVVFQSCIACEMQSGYATQDNFTDAMALLYNLRYTVSACILDFPKNEHALESPCAVSKTCGLLGDAIKYQNLSTKYERFDFCDMWPTGDYADLLGCMQCLAASDNYFMANAITVLQAGCSQKPPPGVTIGIAGNIFSGSAVRITSPKPTATIDPSWFDHGPLSLSGKVGIAIAGIVVLLIIGGVIIVWRGKRKRRMFLRQLEMQYANTKNGGWPSPQQAPQRDMGETPLSQRPLRGWADSPMTLTTEKSFPRYFSPYSSQYNSPISAQEGQQMAWPETAMGSPREIGISLAERNQQWPQQPIQTQTPQSPETKGKMKEESYEMQLVDTSVNHYYGRAE